MADPGWPTRLLWRESWDHHSHGFTDLGEINSTGLCGHVAATSTLTEPAEYVRRCMGCLMIHGQRLSERLGDDTNWQSQ
jgi:hypothetical protein